MITVIARLRRHAIARLRTLLSPAHDVPSPVACEWASPPQRARAQCTTANDSTNERTLTM